MISHYEILKQAHTLLRQQVVTKMDLEDLILDLMVYRLNASDINAWLRAQRFVQLVRLRHERTSNECRGSLTQSRLNAFMSHAFIEASVSRKQVPTTTCRGVSRLASGQSVRRFLSSVVPDFFRQGQGA